MRIQYKIGDVRFPEEQKPFIIPHCTNDVENGCMGAGVALALLRKWPVVKNAYHAWAKDEDVLEEEDCTTGPFRLGEVQFVAVEDGIHVANMVGQRDVCDFHGIPPVRYEAIRDCLIHLREWLNTKKKIKTICSPQFASHLAGGDWSIVESLIKDIFEKTKYEWVIYSLPERIKK